MSYSFFWGDSPASEFHVPIFRDTLYVPKNSVIVESPKRREKLKFLGGFLFLHGSPKENISNLNKISECLFGKLHEHMHYSVL
jgi:hypothetical protein